jgi:hypothetical protein
MESISIHPDDVFEQLKLIAKSLRTERSLQIIHEICKEQLDRGSADFSIATIGKLSEGRGGPKAQPIRNAGGAMYRSLIEAWSRYANRNTRKNKITRSGSAEEDLLNLIIDDVARVLVTGLLSENKKLKQENQVLKVAAKERVVIDFSNGPKKNSESVNIVAPDLMLHRQEREALRKAISTDTLNKMGWRLNDHDGSVTKDNHPIFSAGYGTAIKKILDTTA